VSTAPPARPRRANLPLILGLIVFATGVAFFVGTRLVGGAFATPTPAPSAVAAASTTPPPTPKPTPTPEATPTPTPGPSLAQLIGQKLVVRMGGTAPSKALLERAGNGEIGGVVLFGFNVEDEEQLAAATRELQEAAAAGGQPPLLIAVDQEGGGIRRLSWAQPVTSAAGMGRMEPDEVRSIGAATGQALAAVGANVDLAPVADVPDDDQSFMRDARRTFSDDPEIVSRMVTAFAEGLASQDVLATAKHFPGIGRVARNTDRFVETVREPADALDRDLAPFRALIAAGVPLIMLSNATYPAFDPDNGAGWSPAIATGLLRDQLGFTGVSITDSLSGTAASRDVSPGSLALKAVSAGTDMIMITGSEESTAGVFDELFTLAGAGRVDSDALLASYQRIIDLKATLGE
jgi:beta-N-acetylhexosaminidase